MTRSVLAALLILLALPLAAQSSEFGLLVGGTKRLNDLPGNQGTSGIKDFTFSNSVREAFYATRLDHGTWFRIRGGQIKMPLATTTTGGTTTLVRGTIDHIDALVDYRFDEPFGSAALFAGIGMYRQKVAGTADDANIGASGGLSADLPLSRRYGIVGEVTYHWIHSDVKNRFVTLTGGLRISF